MSAAKPKTPPSSVHTASSDAGCEDSGSPRAVPLADAVQAGRCAAMAVPLDGVNEAWNFAKGYLAVLEERAKSERTTQHEGKDS